MWLAGTLFPNQGSNLGSLAVEVQGRQWTTREIPLGPFIYLFNLFFIYLFLWLRWVFVAARGLLLVVVSGGYSSLRCEGFSLPWLLLLRSTGFRHVGFSSCGSRALELRLGSCGARA